MPGHWDTQNDSELVAAAAAGDRAASAELIDRHMPAVYGVVMRIVCNAADADDLTQDTFVRAFEYLDRCGPEKSMRAWLLRIATNLAINHLRSRKRERLRYPRIAEANAQREARPDELLDVPAPQDWRAWLSRLDEMQRAAIVLFHFEGMPYVEVAEVLGLPLNTVRTHLHRGRKRLRELMSNPRPPESVSCNVAM